MEGEAMELDVVGDSQVPVHITLNVDSVTMESSQYEGIVSALESEKQAVENCKEQIYSVWLLLVMLILFEFRRLCVGIGQRLRKIRR